MSRTDPCLWWVTSTAGSTLHFRYLAEGGVWFDDETISARQGQDVALIV
jgi:hypothetical protein